MRNHRLTAFTFFASLAAAPALAQERPNPAALIAAQKEATKTFATMDGVWRGSAWTLLSSGEKHTITQTERIGDTTWPAGGAVPQK